MIIREKKLKESYTVIKRKEEELKKREEEVNKREKDLDAKAKHLEELELKLQRMKSSLRNSNTSFMNEDSINTSHRDLDNKENYSVNINYSHNKIEHSLATLRSEFSEKKRDYKHEEGSFKQVPSQTLPSTNYSQNKPPPMRRYHRDSSVGAKLRYNFSKENLVKKPKFFNTKHNFAEYSKFKGDQNTARHSEVSLSNNEFKPPRARKERRNSYVSRKYISDH